MTSTIHIGDRVAFRLSDSMRDSTGTVVDVETLGGSDPVYDPERRAFQVRDDRRGWIRRLYEGEVRKIEGDQR